MEEHGRGKLVACYGMAVLVCSESSAAGEQAPYHRRNRSRVGRLGRVEGVGGVRRRLLVLNKAGEARGPCQPDRAGGGRALCTTADMHMP